MLMLLSVPLGDDSDSVLSDGHILVEYSNCWPLKAFRNEAHTSKNMFLTFLYVKTLIFFWLFLMFETKHCF